MIVARAYSPKFRIRTCLQDYDFHTASKDRMQHKIFRVCLNYRDLPMVENFALAFLDHTALK